MLVKLRARLNYANMMATIAVFLALTGSSYAALKVTGKNVRDGSLTGKDIRNESLGGSDVKNLGSSDVSDGSLHARDFKAGELPAGPQGPQGPKGADGPQGPKGADGPQGSAGVSGYERISRLGSPSDNQRAGSSAQCPPGKRLLGGGFSAFVFGSTGGGSNVPVRVLNNWPPTETIWNVFVEFDGPPPSGSHYRVEASALCAAAA